MASALLGEAVAEVPGQTLMLAMNNPAWMAAESIHPERPSMWDMVSELVLAEAAGRSPRLLTTSALLFGATREHHADLSLDDCATLIRRHSDPVMRALATAILGSIETKAPDPGEAKAAKAPPKTTRRSGAGKKR